MDWLWRYLLNNLLGYGRVALPEEVAPAYAGGVSKAGEFDGDNLLLVGTLEEGCRLHIAHNSPECSVLNAPGLNIRWVVLGYAAADRVSVYRQDLYRTGVASFLIKHHQEVAARLDEGPRDVVPDDCQTVKRLPVA